MSIILHYIHELIKTVHKLTNNQLNFHNMTVTTVVCILHSKFIKLYTI
jgi:hypothetical protein